LKADRAGVEGGQAERRGASVLFEWRDRVASRESVLSPTERHVALTLSLYFSSAGDSCFPGVDALTGRTGLAEKTVRRAVAGLERAGFLRRELPSAVERRRGMNTRYFALVPPSPVTVTGVEEVLPVTVTAVHQSLTTPSPVTVTGAESVIQDDIYSSRAPAPEAAPTVAVEGAAAGDEGSEKEPDDLVSALARLRCSASGDVGAEVLRLVGAAYKKDAPGTLAVIDEATDSASPKRNPVGWMRSVLNDPGQGAARAAAHPGRCWGRAARLVR
jgi:Helix-turn-helix domain